MATEVIMPQMGMTMESGTILNWFKKPGDSVETGEPILEIMTDKINMEVEAEASGYFLGSYYEENEEVPVQQVIAYIGNKDEELPPKPPDSASGDTEEEQTGAAEGGGAAEPAEKEALAGTAERGKVRATPAARCIARGKGVSLEQVEGSGPDGRIKAADVERYLESGGEQVKMTPLARKAAEAKNVKPQASDGRKLTKADVDRLAEREGDQTVKLQGIRKVVAERMTQSAFTAPHVTLTSDIEMTKVISLREELLETVLRNTGEKLSFNHVIMKAVAAALKEHPNLNASLQHQAIVLRREINIGLAVSTDKGLLVPVIKNVDEMGLEQTALETNRLIKKARDNRLKPEELSEGTFTISNLGMYDVDGFTPIINVGETAILGLGSIRERPVAVNGELAVKPMMTASLSFDHRIVDGAPAAAFLSRVKALLEQPNMLLL
jgi:pyruvate dehydrogenase E2 component (dihydrolipoamide acetyltransferase)